MELADRPIIIPEPERHLAILKPGQYDLTSQLDPDSMEGESNINGGSH